MHRRARGLVAVSAVAAGVGFALSASAATLPGAEQRVVAIDDDASDWFGRSVDADGEFAVIGAPGDDQMGTNAGAAYVFRRQGPSWVQIQKLTAEADAGPFDAFGTAVAVARDLIAVGAPDDDDAANSAGAVYLFEWDGSTWTRIEKFLPDDPSPAGFTYGSAVDIGIAIPAFGTVELADVVVGAPRADSFQGVVFLIERNGATWTSQGRFSDSDSGGGNDAGEFGSSVAIRGDQIIGGAPLDDQLGQNTGAAYIFGRGNINLIWGEVAALYPSSPAPGVQFGFSVALDDNVAVVGAPSPGSAPPAGRVFIYDTSTQVLTAGENFEQYGSSVAISESLNLIVVGAKQDNDGGDKAGAIYLVERDEFGTWLPGGKVVASDSAINKEYGEAVAVQGGTVIVGGSEEAAFSSGAAYIYSSFLFGDGFETGDTSAWSSTVP